ncbi:hypothetical protein D3C81_842870 [compost metagenome]
MLPQVDAQLARPVERRAYRHVGDQSGHQPRIEQGETGGQHTGFGLQPTHQHPLHTQLPDVLDGLCALPVAMLDEHLVGLDQALVLRSRVPAQLALERRDLFIVQLDRGNGGDVGRQPAQAVDQPLGRAEGGLDIDDEQNLAHSVLPPLAKWRGVYRVARGLDHQS